MVIYFSALLIGVVAGLRAMTAPAAVSWAAFMGWLIFRETEIAQLLRHVQLSPWETTALGRSAGLYLLLLVGLYSIPLWIHDLWGELKAPNLSEALDRPEPAVRWPRVTTQAALGGVMVAAILTLRSQTALDFIYFAF